MSYWDTPAGREGLAAWTMDREALHSSARGEERRFMGHRRGLYIAEDGRVECAEHAPFAGSDTWLSGHYLPVTEDLGLRCEICGRDRLEAEDA